MPVMNPSTGSKYDVVARSANGTEYEIASGDTPEDLGEKKIDVLMAEGALRGYGSRCAEVTKALQSVRARTRSVLWLWRRDLARHCERGHGRDECHAR